MTQRRHQGELVSNLSTGSCRFSAGVFSQHLCRWLELQWMDFTSNMSEDTRVVDLSNGLESVPVLTERSSGARTAPTFQVT